MLDLMVSRTAVLAYRVSLLAPTPSPTSGGGGGPIPDPGGSEAPPFEHALMTMVKWGMWGALLCCVVGFIIIGARMALQHKRGEGGGHVGSMAIVGFATVVIITAHQIVSQLAGSGG